MATFFNQVERVWFMKHTAGVNAQTPIGSIKRKYFTGYSGVLEVGDVASQIPLGELEWRWLINYINDNGGTVTDNDNYSDIWKKMVITTGETPTKYINQNQIIFYQNAA